MEKTIKLAMCEDKSLKIYANCEEKHAIDMESRSISADKIYEVIGFAIGDNYTVITENEPGVDNEVLVFFQGLFDEIVNKVNAIDEQ